MAILGYSLNYAPDLSLVKYQALGDNNADGLISRHNAFLRQWNRISILAEIRLHLIIRFLPQNPHRERMNFYLLLSTPREDMLPVLNQLIKASPLTDYFVFSSLDKDNLNAALQWDYCNEAIIKKTERRRNSDSSNEANSQSFYLVSGWNSSDNARLRDMLRVLNTLQEDIAYIVSFEGIDAFETVSRALEKPISYLHKKTASGFSQNVSLGTNIKPSYRDVAAEETLDAYENFLTHVTESPCFYVNIRALSNSKVGGELLLSAAAGEALEDGNVEILPHQHTSSLNEIVESHQFYSTLVPDSLKFWPTLFTIEELSPFFRFPILLESLSVRHPRE